MQTIYIDVDTESDQLYLRDEFTGLPISFLRLRSGNTFNVGVRFTTRGRPNGIPPKHPVESLIIGINRADVYGAGGLLTLASLDISTNENGYYMGVLSLNTQQVADAFEEIGQATMNVMLGVRYSTSDGIWDSTRFDLVLEQPVIPNGGNPIPIVNISEIFVPLFANNANEALQFQLPAISSLMDGQIYSVFMAYQAIGASVVINKEAGDESSVQMPIVLSAVGGVRLRASISNGWQLV